MSYYSLLIDEELKTLHAVARSRNEALADFEKKLGVKLSLEDNIAASAVHLLDEWEENPHWVNHHIRVFASNI